VQGVTASVQGEPEEDAGFLAPVAAALERLDEPALPGALFAMAALAAMLLAVAAMPAPVRTSRAGAMLVHKRGSIALAGVGALVMALTTYLLL
jgi:hypothetical protein